MMAMAGSVFDEVRSPAPEQVRVCERGSRSRPKKPLQPRERYSGSCAGGLHQALARQPGRSEQVQVSHALIPDAFHPGYLSIRCESLGRGEAKAQKPAVKRCFARFVKHRLHGQGDLGTFLEQQFTTFMGERLRKRFVGCFVIHVLAVYEVPDFEPCESLGQHKR